MNKIARFEMREMVEMIDEPNRSNCRRILRENIKLFKKSFGSTHNHQNWPGGYYDHITEVMNIAVCLHQGLSRYRPLPFSLSDALLVSFLHDIEKPWKYEVRPNGELRHTRKFRTKESQLEFVDSKVREYDIILSEDHKNALRYVHGEGSDYSPKKKVMGPLAAFCHMCDTWSARGWFNHPGDPWAGARRIRCSS